MKKFIWFDLGYTLLYLKREGAYKRALSEFGFDISLQEIERGFHFMDKLFMREFPGYFGGPSECYMLWYVGRLNAYLNVKADIHDVYYRWMKLRGMQPRQWEAYPFCRRTLSELRASGVRTGVISNWDSSARPILAELELDDCFEHIVISSEIGIEKPDVRIFNHAMELAGVRADDCLYIGDNYYDDAVGSRAAGMDCMVINRFGRFGVEEIEDCEIIDDIRAVSAFCGAGA